MPLSEDWTNGKIPRNFCVPGNPDPRSGYLELAAASSSFWAISAAVMVS